MAEDAADLPTLSRLDDLAALVEERGSGLFVRWSRGPDCEHDGRSRDGLTGVALPGLSANSLRVEDWWGDRPVRTWVARRLYDYRHLQRDRGAGIRPWVLEGREIDRGPDNEPLVECLRPVAWVADAVVGEAVEEVERSSQDWGPLRRRSSA